MTEQAIQNIKQIQESTGFIEDIIYNNSIEFCSKFLPEGIPYLFSDIVFDSGCVIVYCVYVEDGCIYVSYNDLAEWINSI